MNKSTLFLFYMLSITTFSCSAMDLAKIANIAENNLLALYEFAFNSDKIKAKSSEEAFRESLKSFNDGANTLKENANQDGLIISEYNNNRIRYRMNTELDRLQINIEFLVNVGRYERQHANDIKESLRLTHIKTVKEKISPALNSTTLTIQELESSQKNINLIADFSIDANLQANISDSRLLFESSIDIEELNKETRELLKAKQAFDIENERLAQERLEQILLAAKEKKIQVEQLKKTKQSEQEKLQEAFNAEKQEIEKKTTERLARAERLKLKRTTQDQARLAEILKKEDEAETFRKKQEKQKSEEITEQKRIETKRLELKEIEAEQILAEKLKLEDEKLKSKNAEADRLERLENAEADRLERLERIEADRLEVERNESLAQLKQQQKQLKQQQKTLKQEFSGLQKKATMRRYMWATGIGIVGLTAAIIWYCNLHTKYIPWFNHA